MRLEVITREPTPDARPTPLLFVHGMWHAAWCWSEHFLPYFAQHGFKSYALSLRGHGASEGREQLRWTPLGGFVSDVAQAVDQLDSPPVLVGHSMGGMVVQEYLESHQAPACVMLASAPVKGLIAATLRAALRHPLTFLKVNLTLSLTHNISTPELYKEAFFSTSIPWRELTAYHAQVQDEATAQAYKTRAEFFSDMGHAMMLDIGWQAVADRILDWFSEQGL